MAVCITGRTASLKVCENEENGSKSVQRLCVYHAKRRPVDYWISFVRKLEKAGIKSSIKINEFKNLSMKAFYCASTSDTAEQCATVGCYQRPVGNTAVCQSCLHARQRAQSQKCCSSTCNNLSLTRFGFCLQCSTVARQSRYSAIPGLAAILHGKQRKTCANPDCVEFLADASEFCSECAVQLSTDTSDTGDLLASDAHTRRHLETAGAKSLCDGEHQNVENSIEPVSAVEHTSRATTVKPVKPRRLFGSELTASSGDIGSAIQPSLHVKSTACIGPVCINEGLDKYRGLCAACHTVLVKVNYPQGQMSTNYGSY